MKSKRSDITDSIRKAGLRAGADAVGIAGVEALRAIAPDAEPEVFLHGAANVIIALVADPPGIADAATAREYFGMAYPGYRKADGAVYVMGGELERMGYKTKFVVRDWHKARNTSGKMLKTIPLKETAKAAGLGAIGLSSLLISPKYGPRVRLSGLITDAPLSPDTPFTDELCDNCGKCVSACPSGAIGGDTRSPFMTCSAYLFSGIKIKELQSSVSAFDFSRVGENFQRLGDSISGWAEAAAAGRRLYYNCGNCVTMCNVHERLAKKQKAQSAGKRK